MGFVDTVFYHGKTVPHRPAIILMDRVVTYAMLADAIRWVTARCQDAGIKAGETVAIMIENPIRHLTVAYALRRLGAVTVSARGDQMSELPALGTRIVMTAARGVVLPGGRTVLVDDTWFTPRPVPQLVRDPSWDDPGRVMLLALTSGTTGRNKAIAFTVAEFEARLHVLTNYHWAQGNDRDLLLVGLSSQWALSEVARSLSAGRTMCFAADAGEALRMIDFYQVGILVGSPQQLRVVVDSWAETPATCASLHLVMIAGGALSPGLAEQIRRHICPRLLLSYGSTEAGKTAIAPAELLRDMPYSTGYVVPTAEVEIVDDLDQVLPPGQQGRIRIKAPAGGRPYQAGDLYPDQTPDWFYPGDIGSLSEAGVLTVFGRADDLINAGGLKLAPERVEELVADHDAVADAAAFGVAGASDVEQIWLAVVARRPVAEAELRAWCARKSADLVPERIVVVGAIPRNAMGKVERRRLRDQVTGQPH
ncbi:MAG: acyl--CoA ligase [Rhizobiales bacterium]|nr:acyl--CoA ligase [Hyphomicrobiales bacterium]